MIAHRAGVEHIARAPRPHPGKHRDEPAPLGPEGDQAEGRLPRHEHVQRRWAELHLRVLDALQRTGHRAGRPRAIQRRHSLDYILVAYSFCEISSKPVIGLVN